MWNRGAHVPRWLLKKSWRTLSRGKPWPRNERLFRGVTLKTWRPCLGGKNYLGGNSEKVDQWEGKNVSLKLEAAPLRTFVLDRNQPPSPFLLKFHSYSLINSSITVREELPLLKRCVPRVSNDFFSFPIIISTPSFLSPVSRQTSKLETRDRIGASIFD